MQTQLGPVTVADQPVQRQARGQQQPRRTRQPGEKAQHGPDRGVVGEAQCGGCHHGQHQPDAIHHELLPQIAHRCGNECAGDVTGVIEGRQPARCQVGETGLAVHHRQHGGVGKAREPHREDEGADACKQHTQARAVAGGREGGLAGWHEGAQSLRRS